MYWRRLLFRRQRSAMRQHHLLLSFGLSSLVISLALCVMVIASGVSLLRSQLEGTAPLIPLLTLTCLVAGICAALLSGLQFAQLTLSERERRRTPEDERQRAAALLHWARSDAGLDQAPVMDHLASEALLKIRDATRGPASERLAELYRHQGWLARDLSRVHSRRVPQSARAEAIERLAMIGHPEAVRSLGWATWHTGRELQGLALLAFCRCLGRLELDHHEMVSGLIELRGLLTCGRFGNGQVQEALALTRTAGLPLAADLLATAETSVKLATLEAISRHPPTRVRAVEAVFAQLYGLLRDSDPELRAGALKVIGRMQRLPDDVRPAVLTLCADPVPFVRVQAAHAAGRLSPPALGALEDLMDDPQWWVRRAAAHGLGRNVQGRWRLHHLASGAPGEAQRAAEIMLAELGEVPA